MTNKTQITLECIGLIVATYYFGSLLMLWAYPPPFALSSVVSGSPCSNFALSRVLQDVDLYDITSKEQYNRYRVWKDICDAQ